MNSKRFWGAIFRPFENLKELSEEPAFKQGPAPGLALLGWATGILGLLAYGVAWLLHLAAVGSSGIVATLLGVIDRDLPLSPFSALLDLAKTYAVQAFAALAMAWCLDWLVRKWWKPGPERWVRYFNAAAHATIPLVAFMIIPIVGMLVAAVYACIALYQLAVRLYAPGHWTRVVGGLVLSSIPAALAAMLLSLALGLIISPLESVDPFYALQRHFEQARDEKAVAALAQLAPTPAPVPTSVPAAMPAAALARPQGPARAPQEPASQSEPSGQASAQPAPVAPAPEQAQPVAQAQATLAPTEAPAKPAAGAADKIQSVNNAVDAARKISSFFH
jgi:hypothetical protein